MVFDEVKEPRKNEGHEGDGRDDSEDDDNDIDGSGVAPEKGVEVVRNFESHDYLPLLGLYRWILSALLAVRFQEFGEFVAGAVEVDQTMTVLAVLLDNNLVKAKLSEVFDSSGLTSGDIFCRQHKRRHDHGVVFQSTVVVTNRTGISQLHQVLDKQIEGRIGRRRRGVVRIGIVGQGDALPETLQEHQRANARIVIVVHLLTSINAST